MDLNNLQGRVALRAPYPQARTRQMEIATRGFWTLIHGMGFGALYLLACSGALVELYRFITPLRRTKLHQARNAF
jgi:hypothetical protein